MEELFLFIQNDYNLLLLSAFFMTGRVLSELGFTFSEGLESNVGRLFLTTNFNILPLGFSKFNIFNESSVKLN